MDGTLTQAGRLDSSLINALEILVSRGIQVLLVTGRSAGWVSGLKTYLPLAGAIAENGGIYYHGGQEDTGRLLTPIANRAAHRDKLRAIFRLLQQEFPYLVESSDNAFRLTDWTFENRHIKPQELDRMRVLCHREGWGFTYSSIQCHIKPLAQEKGAAVLQVAKELYGELSAEQIVTVGDSPNDESLFCSNAFPHSVGVANILHYTGAMACYPAYVTAAAEGAGFCELSDWLLEY